MKTITIDAVWAWAIIFGPKRVENRTWSTSHRGPLAIHAGKNRSREAHARAELARLGVELPEEVPRGVILGTVDLLDCVRKSPGLRPLLDGDDFDEHNIAADPFASGPICWILADPQPLGEPITAVGKQGLWNYHWNYHAHN